jgi:hypothetical protein
VAKISAGGSIGEGNPLRPWPTAKQQRCDEVRTSANQWGHTLAGGGPILRGDARLPAFCLAQQSVATPEAKVCRDLLSNILIKTKRTFV